MNAIRSRLGLFAVLTLLLLASACADGHDHTDFEVGQRSGAATQPSPCGGAPHPGADLPREGVSRVSRPLCETSRWENAPCDVLTEQLLAKVDFDPYRATATSQGGGPGCDYDQFGVITAYTTIGTQLPDGLSGLYAEKDKFALFEPTDPLKGHPAVIADTKDQRHKGRCAVFVGLRDDLTYRTIVESDPKTRQGKNPCKFAADLTVLALHTMQEGQP